MNNEVLDNTSQEKDLGVIVTNRLNWNSHHKVILAKANQKLGLMKRTCNFNKNRDFRKLLYLAIIRSQFEHASPVWRPTVTTQMYKFEALQKKCIKWILNMDFQHLSSLDLFMYLDHLDILPMYLKFRMNDLVIFHKVVYDNYVVKFPAYIMSANTNGPRAATYFVRQTRQFNDNDTLKFKSSVAPRIDIFKNSFFIRTLDVWNRLPLNIRDIECVDTFKLKLKEHLWVLGREDMGIT